MSKRGVDIVGRIIRVNKDLFVVTRSLGRDDKNRHVVNAAKILSNGLIMWRSPTYIEDYKITNRKPITPPRFKHAKTQNIEYPVHLQSDF